MLDPISISIAVSACIVAILTHLKFSKCCGFEIKTRNIQKDANLKSSQDGFLPQKKSVSTFSSDSPPDSPSETTNLLMKN